MDATNLKVKGQEHGAAIRSAASQATKDAKAVAQGTKNAARCALSYVRGVIAGVAARQP
jgi:hypothetical protein